MQGSAHKNVAKNKEGNSKPTRNCQTQWQFQFVGALRLFLRKEFCLDFTDVTEMVTSNGKNGRVML